MKKRGLPALAALYLLAGCTARLRWLPRPYPGGGGNAYPDPHPYPVA